MQNLNPIHWVTSLIKQIKEDFKSTESQWNAILNMTFLGKYYEYNCKRCGCGSSVELCKACDY